MQPVCTENILLLTTKNLAPFTVNQRDRTIRCESDDHNTGDLEQSLRSGVGSAESRFSALSFSDIPRRNTDPGSPLLLVQNGDLDDLHVPFLTRQSQLQFSAHWNA
jgi:hypothetical protein